MNTACDIRPVSLSHPRRWWIPAFVGLALALTACHGEDPVIPPEPDPSEWVDYLGDGGDLADGSLVDAAPPLVCTVGQGDSTILRVINTTRRPIVMWWVDYGCVERPYQTVPPGEFRDQQTFVQHVWSIRTDDGDLIRQISVADTPTEVVEL